MALESAVLRKGHGKLSSGTRVKILERRYTTKMVVIQTFSTNRPLTEVVPEDKIVYLT